MQVFLMWAGEKSHMAARALKEFLEFVVRGPKYFISDDIEGGRLWRVTLAGELEAASFGIACLTRDNLRSHWLHFEAGALSKAVGQANVVPFLVGPQTTDVEGPLADFQMIMSDQEGTRKLVSLLASRVVDAKSDVVDKSFGFVWPDLDLQLSDLRAASSPEAEREEVEREEPVRHEAALIREILERVRRVEGRMESTGGPSHKPNEPAKLQVDTEMLAAIKGRIVSLLDSVSGGTTQASMDDAIDGWRKRLEGRLSVEELMDVYRQARSLELFLDR